MKIENLVKYINLQIQETEQRINRINQRKITSEYIVTKHLTTKKQGKKCFKSQVNVALLKKKGNFELSGCSSKTVGAGRGMIFLNAKVKELLTLKCLLVKISFRKGEEVKTFLCGGKLKEFVANISSQNTKNILPLAKGLVPAD